jgi:hypothetical protein
VPAALVLVLAIIVSALTMPCRVRRVRRVCRVRGRRGACWRATRSWDFATRFRQRFFAVMDSRDGIQGVKRYQTSL